MSWTTRSWTTVVVTVFGLVMSWTTGLPAALAGAARAPMVNAATAAPARVLARVLNTSVTSLRVRRYGDRLKGCGAGLVRLGAAPRCVGGAARPPSAN